MTTVLAVRRSHRPTPESYLAFVSRAASFVQSKGIRWDLPVQYDGRIPPAHDWDLRILTDSHARIAARIRDFLVDVETQSLAHAAGWAIALLPKGTVLDTDVQTFIKAIAAQRTKVGINPRTVRHELTMLKKFFSVTTKRPWELSTDDFNRFSELLDHAVKVEDFLSSLSRLMNENLLSLHVPLLPTARLQSTARIQATLNGRRQENKLPEVRALHELARIIFQEQPVGHQDRMRFLASQLLVLTGLRLNEVLLLPADCLRWETHVDVVTGRPANEVGGVTRSLRLRYFGEKRADGGPSILVEDYQWIPERFQHAVARAVGAAMDATTTLRATLNAAVPRSRSYKTTAGSTLHVKDLLLLVLVGKQGELPEHVPSDSQVDTVAQSSLYQFLGVTKGPGRHTVFSRYGKAPGTGELRVNPHSLRHMMTTEFFRLQIPDTVITRHFGRSTVVQSYEYDHRSLSERLAFVQLPPSADHVIAAGSVQETMAKMVLSGFASGSHIAQSFRKIQDDHGDEAAFDYLAANSDGFHVTPYGFCATSFAVNPCVRHLKCFDGCKHYVASGIAEHKVSLEQLRSRLTVMRDVAKAKPATSLGRKNQIAHADRLLSGVNAALTAQPGTAVFENGQDFTLPVKDLFQ